MKKILYRKSQDWEIWFKIARHQKLSRNILKLRTNWRRFPTTGQQAHVCAPKPVGMSLADEAQNIFLILRDEITKINALLDLYGSSITDPKEILKEQKRFYQFFFFLFFFFIDIIFISINIIIIIIILTLIIPSQVTIHILQ